MVQYTNQNGILMESVLSLEKNLGNVEFKINTLFNSINTLLEYSSNSGNNIIELRNTISKLNDNIVYKEDVIEQFLTIRKEIKIIETLLIEKSVETQNLILVFSEKLDRIERELESFNSQDSSKNKGLFKKWMSKPV